MKAYLWSNNSGALFAGSASEVSLWLGIVQDNGSTIEMRTETPSLEIPVPFPSRLDGTSSFNDVLEWLRKEAQNPNPKSKEEALASIAHLAKDYREWQVEL